ncbi:PilZ domain-containing protein [Bradyrhizobium sp. CER78]|uniref:PilZ domain-containing protein n=1 Tax=Bradyrhizobium sp. CER78 TaxID=3039162 RepID=UPI002446AED6|nr:PilZ domain-containing protein [Bradyrhizobium sp. CER78]MDH2380864.1 PilZ domain-containing protein [Bradyrhizobium sp. CER78]
MNTKLTRYKTDSRRIVLMKRGTICSGDTSIGCVVLNMSTGGAGLAVESDEPIPFAFELKIESEPIRRRCVVAWRLERRLGVTFECDQLQRPK